MASKIALSPILMTFLEKRIRINKIYMYLCPF